MSDLTDGAPGEPSAASPPPPSTPPPSTPPPPPPPAPPFMAPSPPPWMQPVGPPEYLSAPIDLGVMTAAPLAPRRSRRTSWIATSVAMALLVGGGVAVAKSLAGDGAQPDDVIPADVIAVVRLDADPPAGQKLAVAQLAMHFKDSGVTNSDDPIGQLLERLFAGSPDISYSSDIKPWVDKRAAFAVRLDPSNPDELTKAYPLVVVAYKDESQLRSHIAKIANVGPGKPVGYVIADGFVTFSDTTEHAQASVTAAKASPLSQSPAYRDAFDRVGGDSVVFGWVAYGRVYEKVIAQFKGLTGRSSAPSLAALEGLKLDPAASVAFALRAGSNYAEMQIDGYKLDSSSVLSTESLGEHFTHLPADSAVAVGVAGIDRGVSRALDQADKMLAASASLGSQSDGVISGGPKSLNELLDKLGITRSSVQSILGTEIVGAADGSLGGALSIRTADGAGAIEALTKMLRAIASESNGAVDSESVLDKLHLQVTPDGYALGTSSDSVTKVTGGERPYLGDDSVFRTAVPDADASTVAIYANVDKFDSHTRDFLTEAWGATPMQQLEAIGIGVLSEKDGHSQVRIRVVVR